MNPFYFCGAKGKIGFIGKKRKGGSMRRKQRTRLYVIFVCMACRQSVVAGEVGVTYTTEIQTDFHKGTDWVNLLRIDFLHSLGEDLSFHFSSISVAKTRQEPLVNDLQVFSNIEEDNLAFAPAVMGMEYQTGNSSFFAGIRNVNEDYFTSPCASFFTNSSCGMFPTISANYRLANYPTAAVGLDYKLTLKDWFMEVSVYNGTGYRSLTGGDNVFRFCPDSDGIIGLSSVNYQRNGSGYYMGACIHRGMCMGDEEGVEEPAESSAEKKKITYALWGYAEQRISRHVYALLQYSVNPSVGRGCKSYAGIGGVISGDKVSVGAFVDYAGYTAAHEWAGELSCRLMCTRRMTIQPAVHLICNSLGTYAAGLLRMYYAW